MKSIIYSFPFRFSDFSPTYKLSEWNGNENSKIYTS